MLVPLSQSWGVLLFRSILAILFGLTALLMPGLTLAALVLYFGAFALLSGIATLVVAFGVKGEPGFGTLLFEAILGIATGLLALFYPGLTAIALLAVIATWAILIGAMAIVTAIRLRREMTGEWIRHHRHAVDRFRNVARRQRRRRSALAGMADRHLRHEQRRRDDSAGIAVAAPVAGDWPRPCVILRLVSEGGHMFGTPKLWRVATICIVAVAGLALQATLGPAASPSATSRTRSTWARPGRRPPAPWRSRSSAGRLTRSATG